MTSRRASVPVAVALLVGASLSTGSPASARSATTVPGCGSINQPGGDWPTYGHDLSNTRSQPREKGITRLVVPTLAPAWTFSTAAVDATGDFTGTPSIADGCVFVGSNDGWVFAMNADTGKLVWKLQLTAEGAPGRGGGGGINSSVTISGGRVFVAVSRAPKPYVAALSERDGKVLWFKVVDTQTGSDVYASPVVFDGMVFEGWSGGSAELSNEDERHLFQGGFVLLDAATGKLLRKTYTIRAPDTDPEHPRDLYAGGAIWSTPAIDPATKMAYVGGGNPFRPEAEHAHTNAILKIDLNRRSRTFGRIVDSYKGTPDEYVPFFSKLPCIPFPKNLGGAAYPQGLGSCGDVDMDFGSSPNLFRTAAGRLLVGEGQKSGIYHVVDARTMDRVWTTLLGPPSQFGGIVGSTAYDGTNIYGPIVPAGYLWSVDKEAGGLRWAAPVGDAAHWGNPVAQAGGIVYTVDLRGFLDAYDAPTGVPLLHRPLMLQSATDPMLSWGGVSIARNTVYAAVGITGLPTGYVIAFRPGGGGSGGGGGLPPVPALKGLTIVSGPGGSSAGYLTPAMVVQQGGNLTYANADLVKHNVVQDPRTDHVSGPSNQPWCSRFPKGACPVFWSDLIGLGQSAPVLGLENLQPGTTYTFYCTLHPNMIGRIVALPSG